MRLLLFNLLVSLAAAGRLKLRMIEVEKELEIQKKINQQQTLILLHLGKSEKEIYSILMIVKNSKKQKKRRVDLSALKTVKTIQRRSQTELKINENILELITPNPKEPAMIQPIVEKPTQKPLTIPKSSDFSFFGFRKRTKNEIAMDRIRNIEKFVLDKSAEIKEELEELEEEFKETSDSVRNLIANQFWSSWSEWTPCSTTCERGIMRRHRHCNAETSCIGSRKVLTSSNYLFSFIELLLMPSLRTA
ncbi:unnamed protein product [Oikopleura dioica]|uniref:Uncharacterized protein n=1 Tax=Oikopleura dioica TaxID=34765 RepID=E4XRH4_OIKDI|nr:unnamed protein product [Oikopleura dioica]